MVLIQKTNIIVTYYVGNKGPFFEGHQVLIYSIPKFFNQKVINGLCKNKLDILKIWSNSPNTNLTNGEANMLHDVGFVVV